MACSRPPLTTHFDGCPGRASPPERGLRHLTSTRGRVRCALLRRWRLLLLVYYRRLVPDGHLHAEATIQTHKLIRRT